MILTKYEAMLPTDISENHSPSGILMILIKVQTVFINSNNYTCYFIHSVCKKTK